MKIKKINETNDGSDLVNKINELVDKVNELDDHGDRCCCCECWNKKEEERKKYVYIPIVPNNIDIR